MPVCGWPGDDESSSSQPNTAVFKCKVIELQPVPELGRNDCYQMFHKKTAKADIWRHEFICVIDSIKVSQKQQLTLPSD